MSAIFCGISIFQASDDPLLNHTQNFWANIGVASCQFLILCGLMYMARQVYKFVGFQDKSMMGMILFLNLEVIFQITFYVLNALSYLN